MIILAVDTSGSACSAAVLDDNKILSETYMNGRRVHSETLGPMIDFALSCAGTNVRDVGLFACTVGPGSFTGLRIGIGMIKAFAHASQSPALGVSTLDALATGVAGAHEIVCPIIDARRGEVYTASYQDGRRITDYRAVPLDDVLEAQQGRPTLFLGDGALNYADKIIAADSAFRIAHPAAILQRAGCVGLAAFARYQTGAREDAFSLEPFYLRETQAERVRAMREREK